MMAPNCDNNNQSNASQGKNLTLTKKGLSRELPRKLIQLGAVTHRLVKHMEELNILTGDESP